MERETPIIADFAFHYPVELVKRGWAEYHQTRVMPRIEDVLQRDKQWEDDILLMEYLWSQVNKKP